jgi:clan AA aspartic protease
MGVFRADIRLSNPVIDAIDELNALALVDTGAMHLCIPEALRAQLQLKGHDTRPVRIANGELIEVPYVGPIKIGLMGRECYTGAMVMGNEVLLGAIPLEDLDLHVDPLKGRLIPNPESPERPMSMSMSMAMGVLPVSRGHVQ